MKIPKSFMLAGTRWSVEETSGLNEMGHCDSENATIRLRKDLSPQVKAATFCHELQHAIRYTLGLDEHNEQEVPVPKPSVPALTCCCGCSMAT